MMNFSKELENIILNEYNNVNDKLTGINLLEAFKFNIIPKLSTLSESPSLIEDMKCGKNLIIEKDNNKLEVNLIYNQDSNPPIEKETQNNSLFILINGGLTIDILQNDSFDKYVKLNIYPMTGISLPIGTKIKLNYFKNSFYIEFLNIEINDSIENL